MCICRVKELGCSNKPPPSGSPSEALPAPAEDVPTEANAIPDSSADLKFLIKVVYIILYHNFVYLPH